MDRSAENIVARAKVESGIRSQYGPELVGGSGDYSMPNTETSQFETTRQKIIADSVKIVNSSFVGLNFADSKFELLGFAYPSEDYHYDDYAASMSGSPLMMYTKALLIPPGGKDHFLIEKNGVFNGGNASPATIPNKRRIEHPTCHHYSNCGWGSRTSAGGSSTAVTEPVMSMLVANVRFTSLFGKKIRVKTSRLGWLEARSNQGVSGVLDNIAVPCSDYPDIAPANNGSISPACPDYCPGFGVFNGVECEFRATRKVTADRKNRCFKCRGDVCGNYYSSNADACKQCNGRSCTYNPNQTVYSGRHERCVDCAETRCDALTSETAFCNSLVAADGYNGCGDDEHSVCEFFPDATEGPCGKCRKKTCGEVISDDHWGVGGAAQLVKCDSDITIVRDDGTTFNIPASPCPNSGEFSLFVSTKEYGTASCCSDCTSYTRCGEVYEIEDICPISSTGTGLCENGFRCKWRPNRPIYSTTPVDQIRSRCGGCIADSDCEPPAYASCAPGHFNKIKCICCTDAHHADGCPGAISGNDNSALWNVETCSCSVFGSEG